jgi:hypothetical protein
MPRLSWAGGISGDRYIRIGKVRVLEVVSIDQLDIVSGGAARELHVLLYLRAHYRYGHGTGRVDQGVTERSQRIGEQGRGWRGEYHGGAVLVLDRGPPQCVAD